MQCILRPLQQQYQHRARHLLSRLFRTLRYGLSEYSLYTFSPSEAEALSLLEALTFGYNQGM